MERKMTASEFDRYERLQRYRCMLFGVVLVVAVVLMGLNYVEGIGFFWCGLIAAICFFGILDSSKKLRDSAGRQALVDALDEVNGD